MYEIFTVNNYVYYNLILARLYSFDGWQLIENRLLAVEINYLQKSTGISIMQKVRNIRIKKPIIVETNSADFFSCLIFHFNFFITNIYIQLFFQFLLNLLQSFSFCLRDQFQCENCGNQANHPVEQKRSVKTDSF